MKCLKACILYWYVRDDEVNKMDRRHIEHVGFGPKNCPS